MKLVKEDLSFERGQDPKAAMGIGIFKEVQELINELYDIHDDTTSKIGDPYYDGEREIIERVIPTLKKILGK